MLPVPLKAALTTATQENENNLAVLSPE